MYTPNHAMITIVPPTGTQLIGAVDGTYMLIFDRSLKQKMLEWINDLDTQINAVGAAPAVASSGTSAAPVQGKVIKGDAVFEFAATPPEPYPAALTISAEEKAAYEEYKRATGNAHLYGKDVTKLDETVHVEVNHPDTERPPTQ